MIGELGDYVENLNSLLCIEKDKNNEHCLCNR